MNKNKPKQNDAIPGYDSDYNHLTGTTEAQKQNHILLGKLEEIRKKVSLTAPNLGSQNASATLLSPQSKTLLKADGLDKISGLSESKAVPPYDPLHFKSRIQFGAGTSDRFEAVPIKLIPELLHDQLVCKESFHGRPLHSYELGPQDVLPGVGSYSINSFNNSTEINNTDGIIYSHHPLYSILNSSNTTGLHSNWYHRIEWATDRIFFNNSAASYMTAIERLQREMDCLKECRCFADASRDSVVLLLHALLDFRGEKKQDALKHLGFLSVTEMDNPDIWALYCPLFSNDKVFIKDGIVFTIIFGGNAIPLHPKEFMNVSQPMQNFSVIEAEKIYGTVMKSNQILMDSIIQFNELLVTKYTHTTFPETYYHSRFAMPLAAMVEYLTFRVIAEPLIPLNPPPIELPQINKDVTDTNSVMNIHPGEKEFLNDPIFNIQIQFIQEYLGLKFHPFPQLCQVIPMSDYSLFVGPWTSLSSPQFLLSFHTRKLSVRRLTELLPPLLSFGTGVYNIECLQPNDLIRRFRPEFLTQNNLDTYNHQVIPAESQRCSWFGELEQCIGVRNKCVPIVNDSINTDVLDVPFLNDMSKDLSVELSKDTVYSGSGTVTDIDLTRSEQLRRQYHHYGAISPFSSFPLAKKYYYDYISTRNKVCQHNKPYSIIDHFNKEIFGVPESNMSAIKHMTDILLPTLIIQLNDLFLTFLDSSDVSRSLHTCGLPIKYLGHLYNHIDISKPVRQLIAAEIISRTVRHWFIEESRIRLTHIMFEAHINNLDTKRNESNIHPCELLQRDIIQLFRLLLDPQLSAAQFYHHIIVPKLKHYWFTHTDTVNEFRIDQQTIAIHTLPFKIILSALQCHLNVVLTTDTSLYSSSNTPQIKQNVFFSISPLSLIHSWELSIFGIDKQTFINTSIRSDEQTLIKLGYPINQNRNKDTQIPQNLQHLYRMTDKNDLEIKYDKKNEQAAYLFPHLKAIKEILISIAMHNTTSEEYQPLKSMDRVFRGFYPRVRVVAPDTALPGIRAAQHLIRNHFLRNHRIPNPVHLLNKIKTSTGTTKPLSITHANKIEICTFNYIPKNLKLSNVTNPTTLGNLVGFKASLFSIGSPCHPRCVETDIIQEISITKNIPISLGLASSKIKTPSSDTEQPSTQLKLHTGSSSPCHFFIDLASAVKLIIMASQTVGGSCLSSYSSGTSQDIGIYRHLLALGYIYMQHNFLGLTKTIAQYVSKNSPSLLSIYLRAQELLLQCYLKLGDPSAGQKIFSKIRYFTEDTTNIATTAVTVNGFSICLTNSHMCLAAFYSHNGALQHALDHLEIVLALSPKIFCGDLGHWLPLTALKLMATGAFGLGRLGLAENMCRRLLRGTCIVAFDTTLLEAKCLYILAGIQHSGGQLEEGVQSASEARKKTLKKYNPLHPFSLSCLLREAELHHQFGVAEIECPPIEKLDEQRPLHNELNTSQQFEQKNIMGTRRLIPPDLDILLSLWSDTKRKQARTDASNLYTILFKNLVSRVNKNHQQECVFVEVPIHDNVYHPNTRLVQVPIPIGDALQDTWVITRSRLLGVIKETLRLRVVSIDFDLQRKFMSYLLSLITSASSTILKSKNELFKKNSSLVYGIFEKALEKIKEKTTPWTVIVEPLGVGAYGNAQQDLLEKILFQEPGISLESICLSVLKECCLFNDNSIDIVLESIELKLTPNEWFDKLIDDSLSTTGLTSQKEFIILFDLIRHFYPAPLKELLLFHAVHGLSNPISFTNPLPENKYSFSKRNYSHTDADKYTSLAQTNLFQHQLQFHDRPQGMSVYFNNEHSKRLIRKSKPPTLNEKIKTLVHPSSYTNSSDVQTNEEFDFGMRTGSFSSTVQSMHSTNKQHQSSVLHPVKKTDLITASIANALQKNVSGTILYKPKIPGRILFK